MRERTLSMALMALGVTSAAVLWAHHGPEKVVLDDAGAKAKRAPVEFPHALHAKNVERCDTCHHTQEGLTAKTDADVQTCASCHLDPEPDVPGIREMSPRNNPYHITCIGCHRTEEKGPTACNDCHPRS